jgi:hypothetical protein
MGSLQEPAIAAMAHPSAITRVLGNALRPQHRAASSPRRVRKKMQSRLGLGIAAAAVLAAMLLASGARAAHPTSFPAASMCSAGYVAAQLSWGDKCLRTGEFCKIGNPEYHAYSFDCPISGHLTSYSGSSTSSDTASHSAACGVERWTVKTLQDRPTLLRSRATTIHFLVTRPAPHPLPTTRLPFERHIYTVVATVTLVRQETDSDLHVVLQAGGEHMIAEAPSPSCDSMATAFRRKQMRVARNHVRLCARARVTGVAFFDFKHGQTGVAPNAIELHPILAFRCLSG